MESPPSQYFRLLPEERLLWVGKPDRGAYDTRAAWRRAAQLAGTVLLVSGMLALAHGGTLPLIAGLAVVAVVLGATAVVLHLQVPHPGDDCAAFAVTNTRLLFRTTGFRGEVRAYAVRRHRLTYLQLVEGRAGVGSIYFTPARRGELHAGLTLAPILASKLAPESFVAIPCARDVHDRIVLDPADLRPGRDGVLLEDAVGTGDAAVAAPLREKVVWRGKPDRIACLLASWRSPVLTLCVLAVLLVLSRLGHSAAWGSASVRLGLIVFALGVVYGVVRGVRRALVVLGGSSYVVTNRRLLIENAPAAGQREELHLGFLPPPNLERGPRGSGTIWFGAPPRAPRGPAAALQYRQPALVGVPDAMGVYRRLATVLVGEADAAPASGEPPRG